MVFSIPGNVAPFVFEMEGQDLRVLDFSLRERISSPFELELTLASEDEIDFQDALLREGLFAILGKDANRYVHGVVNRFSQTGTIEAASRTRFFLYSATVVPSLSLLSLEQDCRIFQNQSVPEIVKTVLQEGGVPADSISFRLRGSYEPKEYCVQYRETDLNFISRLLEEEGIFYLFEHAEDGHTMIFGDSVVNYAPIPGKSPPDIQSRRRLGDQ